MATEKEWYLTLRRDSKSTRLTFTERFFQITQRSVVEVLSEFSGNVIV